MEKIREDVTSVARMRRCQAPARAIGVMLTVSAVCAMTAFASGKPSSAPKDKPKPKPVLAFELPEGAEGDFLLHNRGQNGVVLSMRTVLLNYVVPDADDQFVAARIDLASLHCLGNFSGVGPLKGNTAFLSPYPKPEDTESASCVIRAVFAAANVTLSETPECMRFHGARCGFEAVLNRSK